MRKLIFGPTVFVALDSLTRFELEAAEDVMERVKEGIDWNDLGAQALSTPSLPHAYIVPAANDMRMVFQVIDNDEIRLAFLYRASAAAKFAATASGGSDEGLPARHV